MWVGTEERCWECKVDEGRNRQGPRHGWRVVGRSIQVAEGGERDRGGERLSLGRWELDKGQSSRVGKESNEIGKRE